MKINFKIFTVGLLFILLLTTFNSCNKDFLDRKPLGAATIGDVETGAFEAKVFGLYVKLRSGGMMDWGRYFFQSVRSDDAMKGSTATDFIDGTTVFDQYNYNATHWMLNNYWNGYYQLIYACNEIINTVDENNYTDEGSLVNKAEAQFLRAFAYFELRRDFGEIPIIDITVVNPEDEIAPKSTIADVDAHIKADLLFAIEHLPNSWSSQVGRATKNAAKAQLAKLYIYQEDWNNALTLSQEVITSGTYALNSSYDYFYSQDGNNSIESIFEVQFARISGQNYASNYWESQGVRGTSTWDLGWGFNVPTTNLINAYEVGDLRKAATILSEGQDDGYGLTVPVGLPQPNWNRKAYTNPAERLAYGEQKNFWENIKLMRYADVLLMAAEAANEMGQTAVASGYVNQIRNRAGLANTSATGQDDMRIAIKHERRLEFALEGERFYDLVRWGDANTVLGPLGYQSKNALMPLPQAAIDRSNGILIQNPNY